MLYPDPDSNILEQQRSQSENVTPVTCATCYRLRGNFHEAIMSNT